MRHFITALFALTMVSCLSPVSNPQISIAPAATSSGLPLGTYESVYVGRGDGGGVWRYARGSNGWTLVDWSSLYPNGNFPTINALAVDGSKVYAATATGLIVGEGSSAARPLAGVELHDVALDSVHSQVLAGGNGILEFAPWSSGTTSSLTFTSINVTQGSIGLQVRKILVVSGTVYLATSGGLFTTAAPVTSSSAFTATSASSNVSTGSVRTLLVRSSGTLVAGTDLGVSSLSSSTWTDVASSQDSGYLEGAVTGLAESLNGVLMATTTDGLCSTTAQAPTSTSWIFQGTTGIAPLSIVASADKTTFYIADGVGGLGIATATSAGSHKNPATNWYPALAGWNVTCVALGP